MKCYNSACDSISADEVNISVNISLTEPQEEKEYTGYTEYGDTSGFMGTLCPDCGLLVWAPDALATATIYLQTEGLPGVVTTLGEEN